MFKAFNRLLVISLVICCAVVIGGTAVPWMGTTYTVPSVGESDWAGPTKVDGLLISIGTNAFSKAGGTFTLQADANFGSSYGLLSKYFTDNTGSAATAGAVRLSNGASVSWLNAAGSANLPLGVNGSNSLVFNGSTLMNSSGVVPAASGGTGISSYAVGDTVYANSTTTLTKLNLGGSSTLYVSTGTAPQWAQLTNAMVDPGAAIARSKVASGTNYRILANSSSGAMGENAALTSGHVVYADANGQLAGEAVLATSRGGTNISSYTTGDVLYASNASTVSKLGIGSAGQVLKVSGGLPSWGAASVSAAVQNQTTSYTILNTDDSIFASSSGGSLTLSLPSAASNAGKVFYIEKTDSSTNLVNVSTTTGGDTVDGIQTTKMGSQYDSLILLSDGVATWRAIANKISVIANYEISGARSITDATATTGEFLCTTKIQDSHSAYSTSTAIFTCPVSGAYRVTAGSASASSAGWANTEVWQIRLFKNGSYVRLLSTWSAVGTATTPAYAAGSTVVSCAVGETLEPRIFQNSGSSLNTSATAADNYVVFERIGN